MSDLCVAVTHQITNCSAAAVNPRSPSTTTVVHQICLCSKLTIASREWLVLLVFAELNHIGVCLPLDYVQVKSALSSIILTTIHVVLSYRELWDSNK